MPKSLQELRIHENEITKFKKASFQGMSHMIVMGMKIFFQSCKTNSAKCLFIYIKFINLTNIISQECCWLCKHLEFYCSTLFTHNSAHVSRKTPRGFWPCRVTHSYFLFFFVLTWTLSISHSVPTDFVLELGSNPLKSAGVEPNAFADLKRVSYIRIADTNITEIPKGTALPSKSSRFETACVDSNIKSNVLHIHFTKSTVRLTCFVVSVQIIPIFFQACPALSLSSTWMETRSLKWQPTTSRAWRTWQSNDTHDPCICTFTWNKSFVSL